MAEGNGQQVIREREQHLIVSWNTRKDSYQTLILILLQETGKLYSRLHQTKGQAWKGQHG